MKTCVACGVEKPSGEFYPKKGRCKPCYNARVRTWQSRNRDRVNKNRRSGRARYNHLRAEARRRSIPCSLTYEEFARVRIGACAYCGRALPATGGGLDRKDNGVGYTISNVVPCCGRCNQMKSDWLGYEEMLQVGATLKKIYAAREKALAPSTSSG